MSLPVASDAAQAAVMGAGDEIFAGIQLPGDEAHNASIGQGGTTPNSDGGDFNLAAFGGNPEPDFVGGRMAQDDQSLVDGFNPNAPEDKSNVAPNQGISAPGTPQQQGGDQMTQMMALVTQVMETNRQLIERQNGGQQQQQIKEPSMTEKFVGSLEELVKKEFPDDDGTVAKFAKLLGAQFVGLREQDQQALESRITSAQQAKLDAQIQSEAVNVGQTVLASGYQFKTSEDQKGFADLAQDLALSLVHRYGGTPQKYLDPIQKAFDKAVYAKAAFLGNKAKQTAGGHARNPGQRNIQAPSQVPNNPQGNAQGQAPITNWDIRMAGYSNNAEAVFDDFAKVHEMRRRQAGT